MRTVFSRNWDITGQQRAALADASSAASILAVAESVTVVEIGCSFTRAVVRPQGYWAFPLAPGQRSELGRFLPNVAGFDVDFRFFMARQRAPSRTERMF
jgi:hypothetical protein